MTCVFPATTVFPGAGNVVLSENTILNKAVDALRQRLPEGWTANLAPGGAPESTGALDAVVRIGAPDGREGTLVTEVRQRLDPRRAMDMAAQAKARSNGRPTLAIAPWISRSTRELLEGEGLHLVDLTGNLRLVLSEPGLFLEAVGAQRDPWPEASRVTLRGAKAARVVRALCAGRPPLGVRELAAAAKTTPGYVSKLLGMLDEQAAVRRTEAGRVADVDLRRLLERWAEDAPLEARATTTTWIAPRGLTDLQGKLRETGVRYAVTGSLAASRTAPVAAPRVVSVYVDDPDGFAPTVDLRPADAGANVLLLVPDDDYPFEDAWTDEGVRFAALPQVVADLLSGPGRGPAEAGALLTWMGDHGEVWRG
ncbi:MAG: hypothetical protein H6733_16065 [Alphaproteobacteria bacterium]|nr:hypothetical protein [Alphaproteobacteria bacterium]